MVGLCILLINTFNTVNYMKNILAILLIGVFTTSHLGAEPLTASELASHLGVLHWESEVNLPTGSFSVSVSEIKNGKVAGDGGLPGFTAPTNDSSGQKLVVLVSQERSGTLLTVVLGNSSFSNKGVSKKVEIPFTASLPLPRSIGVGSYVLGGDYMTKGNTIICTGKIEDLKSGLLLQISRH